MLTPKRSIKIEYTFSDEEGKNVDVPGPCRVKGKFPDSVRYSWRMRQSIFVEFDTIQDVEQYADMVQAILLEAAKEKHGIKE